MYCWLLLQIYPIVYGTGSQIAASKFKSFIHNTFSSERVILSESEEKYAQIKHKFNMSVDFDVRKQQGRTFALEEALLWIMDLHIVQKWWFKVNLH